MSRLKVAVDPTRSPARARLKLAESLASSARAVALEFSTRLASPPNTATMKRITYRRPLGRAAGTAMSRPRWPLPSDSQASYLYVSKSRLQAPTWEGAGGLGGETQVELRRWLYNEPAAYTASAMLNKPYEYSRRQSQHTKTKLAPATPTVYVQKQCAMRLDAELVSIACRKVVCSNRWVWSHSTRAEVARSYA